MASGRVPNTNITFFTFISIYLLSNNIYTYLPLLFSHHILNQKSPHIGPMDSFYFD